jgi:hypothetical protein
LRTTDAVAALYCIKLEVLESSYQVPGCAHSPVNHDQSTRRLWLERRPCATYEAASRELCPCTFAPEIH